MSQSWTDKQGQYHAFIAMYTKVNGVALAESDMQRYFRVTAPSVHAMVVALDAAGLIERTPRVGRSIRVLVAPEVLPRLE